MERPFFYKETNGIRITVRPHYFPEQSNPARNQYVFVYFIRIENIGRKRVQLLARHWYIHDDIGRDDEVVGDGVVGQQPVLLPGDTHEYNSYCVLQSQSGHMEGSYRFIASDDTLFDAAIPRFVLNFEP